MSLHVIEGTWEEVKLHDAELAARKVRLTIKPEKAAARTAITPTNATAKPKELHGYGLYAGLLSSVEYIREKREDTIREDRSRE